MADNPNTYKQTTFSQVNADLEKFENTPPTATDPNPAPDPVDPPAPAAGIVDPPPPDDAQNPPDNNTSSFNIQLEDGEPLKEPTPDATPPTATFNWKDEIKKVDRKELLKEVGLTDFAIEMNEHLANGGKAEDYLSAKAIDYNAISDEDIVKAEIRKQYTAAGQKISQKQVDILFERKYALADDASEDDKELLDLQLKTDANNLRQSKISEQQKFQVNHTPILQKDEAYEQWKQSQEILSGTLERAKTFFEGHEATKTLNESKRVTIDLGKDVKPFNFILDRPDVITKILTDDGKLWSKLTSTKTGEPDVQKQQLITLFAINPQQFIQDIFSYGRQMGVRKELVDEGQNAQRPQAKVLPVDTNAKATYGTGTYGAKPRT